MRDAEPPQRWDEVDRLFDAALDRAPQERVAFLARACRGDPELFREVAALLRASRRAEHFLAAPALASGAGVIGEVVREIEEDPIRPGARLGPYHLLRELGRGGAGTVFLAERDDGTYRQEVALKVLRRGLDTDELIARFRAERQILASLTHPHIARLLDGGATPDGRPYLVMERVRGEPITDYCDARRLAIDERLALFLTVARAVRHAHQNLVVHRDLKPANILVSEAATTPTAGEVRLLDFGIAKMLDPTRLPGEPAPTRGGRRLLTPEYASPEQVRGGPVSTATDVYQLGLLLYQLLTGHNPQEAGGDAAQLERRILEEVPPPPSARFAEPAARRRGDGVSGARRLARLRRSEPRALRRRLRGNLDAIVGTALRKEPERRYASVDKLVTDVEASLSGGPVSARPEGWSFRARRFARRYPGALAAVVLALLVGVGYLGLRAAHAERLEAERDRARAEAARAEQVSAFLETLLGELSPQAAREDLPSVQTILRGAVGAVESELAEQPRTRAKLLTLIGGIYTDWGMLGEAERLLERALALRPRLADGDQAEVAAMLHALGLWQWRMGRNDEAQRHLREALELRRAGLGQSHPQVAETLNALGVLLQDQGDHGAAERKYREALEIRRAVLPPDDPAILTSMNTLAASLRERGAYAAAERLGREALERRRAFYGAGHPHVATSLHNLGSLERRAGRPELAESLHREGLAIRERWFGPDHPITANSATNLAAVLLDRGDHAAAEALYRRALEIRTARLPPHHPQSAATLVALGRAVLAGGDASRAMPLLREGLELQRANHPEGHWLVADAEATLAAGLAALGRRAEAEPLLHSAEAFLTSRFGEDDARVRALGELRAEN